MAMSTHRRCVAPAVALFSSTMSLAAAVKVSEKNEYSGVGGRWIETWASSSRNSFQGCSLYIGLASMIDLRHGR